MIDVATSHRNRVVLITGAGKGIGRAVAEYLGRQGARVIINNRRRAGVDSAGETVQVLRAAGVEAIADHHDVCEAGAAQAMVDAAVHAWGGLDAVVLNAGVSGSAARVADQTEANFREVMETNFFANLQILQACLPQVTASSAGRLLFMASSAGLYGVRGRAPYAASKGALIGMALSLEHELRRTGVGVNVLAPYATTQMTREAMSVEPETAERMSVERVAPVAGWLCSPGCTATGEIWVAGGGGLRRARMMEGAGGRMPAMNPEAWLAENTTSLRSMPNPRGFAGAEEAFADFYARL